MIDANLTSCLSYISGHRAPAARPSERVVRRAVTISRQAGCGGVIVAEKLAEYLQHHSPPPEGVKWAVFDRDLMLQVLADHKLPAHLEKFLPEDRVSAIEDTLAEIFGIRPPTETLVQQTAETILKFAELGGVIIVGRGGNFVTARLPHVLHIRLVAPLEDRIERIIRDDHKTPAAARKFCLEEEQHRARYIRTCFHADINDPVNYHLVVNTSRVGYDHAAKLIGDAVLRLG